MSDYEYAPKRHSGPYLRLSEKGQSIRIRIASKPLRFEEEYEGKVSEKFAWIVIHKDLDANKKVTKVAATFKGGAMIYGAIRDLAMHPDWGDPKGYDITITRTEEKGKYYTVMPSPNGKPISEEEMQMIADADLDLERMYLKNARQPKDEDSSYNPFDDE